MHEAMASHVERAVDLSENRQPGLYASSTVPFAFAVLSVVLRFWCRQKKRAGLWIDDWLIVIALVCAVGLTADLVWFEYLFIGLFVAELTYTGVIIFVKFSIAALYWRIFEKASIKIPIIIVSALVAMWGTAVFLLTVLQCIPTQGIWDKTIDSSCDVDSNMFLMAISIPNILIDVFLLLLPVPYVFSLHISLSRKVSVLSMFLLGGFVCVASIMRLIAVVNQSTSADMTWNVVGQATWAKMEADFAIISACLPTLRPLYVALLPKRFAARASAGSDYTGSKEESRKKSVQQSWGMSVLRSRDDDTAPLSSVAGIEGPNSHYHMVKDAQEARVTVVLSNNSDSSQIRSPASIRVETAWDVEYSGTKSPRNAYAV
ncbi:hypothetical protein GMORB2_7068 [Geosmithia morbida]|uniref:Rhodopsin domain-containing protein n=1 Tax=Geosmithia morbida TaxID=1094350 RepID=A0A9P5D3Q6_9HYPO|nr:uncharacterized protein GMORB2_7068 [Geosmithia morbida]KAF4122761.1 hypothetical protein GMORB2_7068 [Geosmithia morbida]